MKKHILYLEDDPDDGLLLQTMLDRASSVDFEVTVCDSVDSALLAISLQTFDAVFCDYVLGNDSSADNTAERFVYQLSENFPLVPLVITSGMSRATLNLGLQARITAGSIGFLHKSAWQTGTLIGMMASVQQGIEQARSMPAHLAGRSQEWGASIGKP